MAAFADAGWLEDIRLFMFDLDGVLRTGKERQRLLAGLRIVPFLRQRRAEIRVVTNTTTHSAEQVEASLNALGLDVEAGEIHSALEVTAAYLRNGGAQRCFVIGEQGLVCGLLAHGIETVREGADAVVIGLDRRLTADKILRGAEEVLQGARLVTCHRGRLFRDGTATFLSAGTVAAAIEFATGIQATVTGKPSGVFFSELLDSLAIPPWQTLMIGDSLEADIQGAARIGIRTALVLSGASSRADLEGAGTRPDIVLETADQLVDRFPDRPLA